MASLKKEFRSSLIRFHGVSSFNFDKYLTNPIQELRAFQASFVEEIENQLHKNSSSPYKIIYILPRYGEKNTVLVRFGSSDEAGLF